MRFFVKVSSFIFLALTLGGIVSCTRHADTSEPPAECLTENLDTVQIDTVPARVPVPGDSTYHFTDGEAILTYLDTCAQSEKYNGGIIYTMARETPEYADKIIAEMAKYDNFIVADKASMQVILYDRYGQVLKSYPMACARNYGTKHRRADSRTPEGFFSLEGKYNSTQWLYTNDWGQTSPVKGQFGPRFLRVKHPKTRQIGIHGTGSPASLGHRVSHGCIRIANANILELYDLVEPGIPIIILPGKRDREVNRKEGYDIPYFPTSEQYAMTPEEKALPVNPEKVEEDFVTVPKRAITPSPDEDPDSENAETNATENDNTEGNDIDNPEQSLNTQPEQPSVPANTPPETPPAPQPQVSPVENLQNINPKR